MTLKSMTGYASYDGSYETGFSSCRWTWDIRSVNGKGLDMRLRVPPHLSELDQLAKKCLTLKLARGNIQAHLTFETDQNDAAVSINEDALNAVLTLSAKLEKSNNVRPVSFDGLLALRGVLEIGKPEDNKEEKAAIIAALMTDFDRALDALVAARASEGEALRAVLDTILQEAETLTGAARDAPERDVEAIKQRLDEQIRQLVEDDHGLSGERLYQEALLLATKADIREEIDRLYAHIAAARDLIALSEPVGRRLDFLAQEFNREANTLCSKANHIEITRIGLALKASIDQFREQIQNVE